MSPLRASSIETLTHQQRLVITTVVMLATLMQLLDTTIVNVALPHIKGQLSATPEQVSWILTSYVVAASIFMPLTGFFSDRFGIRNFLLISIAGFTFTSLLCGMAATLNQMVLFRILQGVFGAALVPLSQMVLILIYPPQERGKAMGIWGVGIMAGPILGPTLGGWLTEQWSWHWTFFINVPIGILLVILAFMTMPTSPAKPRRMDWTGFALMAIAVASLQLILDLGERQDWFESTLLRLLVVSCLASLVGFIWHSLNRKDDPLFNLSIFKDRNFCAAVLIISTMTLGFYGATLLVPLMMVGSLNFNTLTAGLMMAPRGITTIVSSILAGHLLKRVDGRILVGVGALVITLGSVPLTEFSLATTDLQVMLPGVLQGLGLGFIFVPLSTMAYATMAPHLIGEATGVFSLLRSMGGSIGIAFTAAFNARHAQIAWTQLRGEIQPTSPILRQWLDSSGLDSSSPQTWQILALELERQSHMVAYVDAFQYIVWVFLAMLPLLLIFKLKANPAQAAVSGTTT
ncbi:MAG: MFS transporter [Porticoccaceae bacterium]|nr:MFS transporter [Porticoccaceae bacterium]